jgi:hypothetical protein
VQAPEQTVLLLFRKDLRLDDNPALLAALQAANRVVSAVAAALRAAMCFGQHTHCSAAASGAVLLFPCTSCVAQQCCTATCQLSLERK